MSTDPVGSGGKGDFEAAAAESARLIEAEAEAARAEEQDDLFDPITSEEAAEAYDQLGGNPGPLSVLRQVKENRKGRPKGAKNRKSADAVAYLSQFGPDPAVVMMKILSESEEAMVARSRQVDPVTKRMSFAEARAIRLRAAEGVRKIFHGDQPVQVDARIEGVRIISQVGEMREARAATIEGAVKGVLPPREDLDREDGEGGE